MITLKQIHLTQTDGCNGKLRAFKLRVASERGDSIFVHFWTKEEEAMIATVVDTRIAFGHEKRMRGRQTSKTTFSSLTEACPPSVGCGETPYTDTHV